MEEAPANFRMHLCGIVQCATALDGESFRADPSFQEAITSGAVQLISAGFRFHQLLMNVCERKQACHQLHTIDEEWSERMKEEMSEVARRIKSQLSHLLTTIKKGKPCTKKDVLRGLIDLTFQRFSSPATACLLSHDRRGSAHQCARASSIAPSRPLLLPS